MPNRYDAVVVGSGPNGLAAAITLARNSKRVLLIEAADRVGGGLCTSELTLPGFRHDVCSAVHPFGRCSPFFLSVPLQKYGIEWIDPPIPFAHPLDDGTAVVAHRSPSRTAAGLGPDADAYRRLMAPLVRAGTPLLHTLLRPLPHPPPISPLLHFGINGLQPASVLTRRQFRRERTRAWFAGLAAHAMIRLDQVGSSAVALALALVSHTHGWPFPAGGAGELAHALTRYFEDLGGEIQTGTRIRSFDDLPPSHTYLFSTDPRQLLEIAGDRFPGYYRRSLENFRFGPGIFKVDYALREPIPWSAPECHLAGTLHLGGTFSEIELSEDAATRGLFADRPYVLLAQPSLFDPTRAPQGQHTAWAYCHAPAGSDRDLTDVVERQIERFAPGFRRTILARHTSTARDIELGNPNYRGGDINAGVQDIRQMFTRPAPRFNPYSTPDPSIYICSSSSPPGGGVHGMAGYQAARSVLARRHI